MAFDAGDEQLVGIGLRVLDEVGGCLFGGNGDEWYALIRWPKPDNLRTFDRSLSFIHSTISPLVPVALPPAFP